MEKNQENLALILIISIIIMALNRYRDKVIDILKVIWYHFYAE